jgi:hypothetical protein
MKYTLLQMTQDILSSMSSDEVNSISDTPEALQVATIIKHKYFDIINRVELPDHQQLFQLQPSIDPVSPVLMTVPAGIADIKWVKYFDSNSLDGNTATDFAHDLNTDITPSSGNSGPRWSSISTSTATIQLGTVTFTVAHGLKISLGDLAIATTTGNANMSGTVTAYTSSTGQLTLNITSTNGVGTYSTWTINQGSSIPTGPGYLYVPILPNDEFIDMVNGLSLQDQSVQSFVLSDNSNQFNGNFTFYYRNNKTPSYCTIISNLYVIFDSYDNTQDSTLQSSKTMVCGMVIPTFQMVDTFIPDLAEEQFQLLVNEAKELAFFELKQQIHPLADREVKRGWSAIQKKKAVINRPTFFDELPGFGRKRGYYGYRNGYYSGDNQYINSRGSLY